MEEALYYGKRKVNRNRHENDDVLYGIFDTNTDSNCGSTKKKPRKDPSINPLNFISGGTNAISIGHNRKDDQSLGFSDSEGSRSNKYSSKLGLGKKAGVFKNQAKKGIGMMLLEKMGYKGGGLGKNEQGMVAPIGAKLRPKNLGIGFNDYKETSSLQEPIEEIEVFPMPDRKKKCVVKKKEKEYATSENQEHVVLKVFDMRGPQVRVLINLQNLNAQEEEEEEKSRVMPELQHNIRLIVDLARLDKQMCGQELRSEKETFVTLQKEKKNLEEDATRMKEQLNIMEEMECVLEQLTKDELLGTLTLESVATSFEELYKQYPDEYKLYGLDMIASSFALPLLVRLFQRSDLEAEVLLSILDTWEKLLPHSTIQNIFGNIVMPKLESVHPENIRAGERREFEESFGRVEMSVKEVIEVHAQHNDLVFKPKVGRMIDGYQVYGFGKISVIVDSLNEKVFAQNGDRWSIVTLEQLVKLEKSSVLRRR